jgi:hypothetical protein
MNPDAIATIEQHEQCNTCLANFSDANLPNVAPCGLCISAVNPISIGPHDNSMTDDEVVLAKRGKCIECVIQDGGTYDTNKDWACMECAKMISTGASKQ